MKELNIYIMEKLHLNKDSKMPYYKKFLDEIAEEYCLIYNSPGSEDYDKEMYDTLLEWITDNSITDVIVYGDHEVLPGIGIPDENIKNYKQKDNKDIYSSFKASMLGRNRDIKVIKDNSMACKVIYTNNIFFMDAWIIGHEEDDHYYRGISIKGI